MVKYFGLPFKGLHSVTQGYPMPFTLYNVVLDPVICHWVMVVAPTADGLEEQDLSIRGIGGIFLCQPWTCSVDQTKEATEVVQRPH